MHHAVVQFLDGEEKKGIIPFFNLGKQTFPLEIKPETGNSVVQTIHFAEVKKILFLKKEKSDSPLHTETIDQSTFAGTVAFKLAVELEDGEVLTGSTLKYNPNDKSFFIIPLNPSDQSERIYINARCVKHVDQKRLLGRVLIDAKMINGEQLQSALERQAEHRNKRLGEILLEKELINKRQLDESLNKQKERTVMLGEILIEAGYISQDQLDKALFLQKDNRKKRLGQILVELKFVTPGDICVALASQLGCSWIDLSTVKIQEEILGLLPREVIFRYEVIPVEKKNDDILVLASAQPRDPDMRQAVSRETPYKLDFVVAYDGHITAALVKYFTSP